MRKVELPHHHGEPQEIEMIQNQIDRTEHFQIVADIFKILGDTTRIRIFWLLCHCEECVINISAMLEMSSPAVSHHLRPLKNSGLIVSRRLVVCRVLQFELGRNVLFQFSQAATPPFGQ